MILLTNQHINENNIFIIKVDLVFFFIDILIMTNKKYSTKCTNDIIKIIVYVVFMTAFFFFYCNKNNDDIENSMNHYHLHKNEAVSSTENGNKNV